MASTSSSLCLLLPITNPGQAPAYTSPNGPKGHLQTRKPGPSMQTGCRSLQPLREAGRWHSPGGKTSLGHPFQDEVGADPRSLGGTTECPRRGATPRTSKPLPAIDATGFLGMRRALFQPESTQLPRRVPGLGLGPAPDPGDDGV